MANNRLSRFDLEAAAAGNPSLRQMLEAIIEDSEAHKSFTGYHEIEREEPVQLRPPIAGGSKNAPMPRGGILAPRAADWTVTGQDGAFILDIVNPDAKLDPALPGTLTSTQFKRRFQRPAGHIALDLDFEDKPERAFRVHAPRQIIHQIQSALDLNFNANSSVVTYGPSPNTHYRITDHPNETRYWRIRSKYANSDWNTWKYWVDPDLCGVVAVSSGVLRSPNMVNNAPGNTGNNATVDSIDAGNGTATIRIYGPGGVGSTWQRVLSDLTGQSTQNVSYPAGTITGTPYSTGFYVMWTGAKYVNVTNFNGTLPDAWVWVGTVKTVAQGGTGGSTGGGGTGGGSGGCVEMGTPVEIPEGTEEVIEEILPCGEWIALTVGERKPINVHPDTLVCVFKKARELHFGDRVEVDDHAGWEPVNMAVPFYREGYKVKRTVTPGRKYKARGIWLHNSKPIVVQ